MNCEIMKFVPFASRIVKLKMLMPAHLYKRKKGMPSVQAVMGRAGEVET